MFDHDHTHIKSEILLELGEMITNMGAAYPQRIATDDFVVMPKKLSDGGCIGLVNKVLTPAANVNRLMVLEADADYTLVVYTEEKNTLSISFFRTLTTEQEVEIKDQIKILKTAVPDLKFPVLFNIVFIANEIHGATYRQDENSLAEVVEVRKIVAEPPIALYTDDGNIGPTPVPFPITQGGQS